MNISTHKEQKAKASIFRKIGIFSASLLTAASAVYIYSPVIGSYADESANLKVDATVNPVASLTLDTSDVSFVFTPTASGVFDSKPVTATVDTNSTGGYELYFSSEDNETNMVNPLASDVIASDFTETVTSETMAANKWGYSLDNTDFSKIPALNAQATLKNIDHYPTTEEKTTTVNIGMKVDTNLPSGTYTKNVIFSVVAHETPVPASTMQEFDPSTLAAGESIILKDARDDNEYTVKKLADGKVWMTQNLRLIDKTISSADSNLPSGETWTIPASSTSGFSSYNTNNAYLDSTYGGYYTFYTATAGWGTNSVTTSGNSPKDICPKGWRLPTVGAGSSGEFQTLYNNYSSPALMQGDPNFTLSGYVSNGSVSNQGLRGGFWSSTVSEYDDDAEFAYRLYIGSSDVYPDGTNWKYFGFSVRCVAETKDSAITMQAFDSSTMIPKTGDSMTLRDIRDDNMYTVKRLADGKVWMTENLRIANKTITSADSNVTSDFTIPASSHDENSFVTDAQDDANNAFISSGYGGYYTFYTATAGTGGTSLTSGDAPSSICPKGWRLPTGGEDSGEFQTLYGYYDSGALTQGEPNFTFPGYMNYGSAQESGGVGDFWSSTVRDANSAYALVVTDELEYDDPNAHETKNSGISVRCVAV